MAKGTCTASTPVECLTPAAVKVAVDALTLANANTAEGQDSVQIIPIVGRTGWYVFKIEQAAA